MIVAGGNLRPSILEENLHRHGSLPQNIGLQESISYFGQKKQCVHYESGKKVYSGPALEFTESRVHGKQPLPELCSKASCQFAHEFWSLHCGRPTQSSCLLSLCSPSSLVIAW